MVVVLSQSKQILQIEGPERPHQTEQEVSGEDQTPATHRELIKATTVRRGGAVLMIGE